MTFPFGLEGLPDVAFEEKEPGIFFSNRTLNANSNIDRVLHFFSKVADHHEGARLVVANDGPEKEALHKLAGELGLSDSLDFVGFISAAEQNQYYRKSQFYFSVLTSDALSVSLLEAMSFGCIPIVSDLPDNQDWVKDGVNGIILKSGTRYDVITDIQKNAKNIFETNREMIEKGALFPKSIREFIRKLESIETSNK